MSPHDRNDVCVEKFRQLENRVDKNDGVISTIRDTQSRHGEAFLALEERVTAGHGRMTTMDSVVRSIDKSLSNLNAVTEEKRQEKERLRVKVDSIDESLKSINLLVAEHQRWIAEEKEGKKNLTGWVVAPLCSGLIGGFLVWLMKH